MREFNATDVATAVLDGLTPESAVVRSNISVTDHAGVPVVGSLLIEAVRDLINDDVITWDVDADSTTMKSSAPAGSAAAERVCFGGNGDDAKLSDVAMLLHHVASDVYAVRVGAPGGWVVRPDTTPVVALGHLLMIAFEQAFDTLIGYVDNQVSDAYADWSNNGEDSDPFAGV